MLEFRIEHHDGEARSGRLNLPHGEISTPAFMPVGTAGSIKASFGHDVGAMGYGLILANTYHLVLRPGLEILTNFHGLHDFAAWGGNILTDSGGFQVFSLAPFRRIESEGVYFRSHIDGTYHRFTPESVVDAQCVFRSDIQMPLDVCLGYGSSRADTMSALETTTRWAHKANTRREQRRDDLADYDGNLFGIVQGGFHEDLRRRSAAELVELDLPGYAIGGLSVGEPAEVFDEMVHACAPMLPSDKPRYVMGIGTPEYIFEAVEAGIDMFDCVFPTRVARNGTFFTYDGVINIKNERFASDSQPLDDTLPWPAARKYSRAYLRHLFNAGEMLGPMLATQHNLWFLASLMHSIREAIRDGSFSSFKAAFLHRYTQGSL